MLDDAEADVERVKAVANLAAVVSKSEMALVLAVLALVVEASVAPP